MAKVQHIIGSEEIRGHPTDVPSPLTLFPWQSVQRCLWSIYNLFHVTGILPRLRESLQSKTMKTVCLSRQVEIRRAALQVTARFPAENICRAVVPTSWCSDLSSHRLWKAEIGLVGSKGGTGNIERLKHHHHHLLLCHPVTATMKQQTRKQTLWYTSAIPTLRVRKTVSSRLTWDTYAVLDQVELQSCYVSELYSKTLPQNK